MFSGNNLEKIHNLGEKKKASKILPYATSKKADERAAAATALGNTSNDDSCNALIRLLRDSDISVCINAAVALKKMGRAMAIEHLRQAAKNSNNETFKAACHDAVASLVNSGKL